MKSQRDFSIILKRNRQSYKCHKYPASGRVFCYNIGMDKKNFATLKSITKVVGIILLLVVAVLRFGSTENGRMKRL